MLLLACLSGLALVAAGAEVRADAATTPDQSAPIHYSPGVADVLKMVDAKVKTEVIRAYIEASTTSYNPTADEIIALTKRGVDQALIAAMLKRGGELRAQQASQPVAAVPRRPTVVYSAPAYPATTPAYGYPYSYSYPSYGYTYPYSYWYWYYPYSCWGASWTYWPWYSYSCYRPYWRGSYRRAYTRWKGDTRFRSPYRTVGIQPSSHPWQPTRVSSHVNNFARFGATRGSVRIGGMSGRVASPIRSGGMVAHSRGGFRR